MRTVSARQVAALAVIMAALMWTSSASVAPAPAPGIEDTCGSIVASLMPCLPFVEGKATKPSTGCCTGAKKLDEKTKTKEVSMEQACMCIQKALHAYPSIKSELMSEIPKMCGINDSSLPPIDAKIDCKKLGDLHYKGN